MIKFCIVLEILLFLLFGVLMGVLMGLVPGLHPNTIVLAVPFLLSLNIDTLPLIALVVAMGVTNSIVDFIPSILLGAPDSGNELSVMPGHRMLLDGQGYNAIKLAVTGAIGSMIVIAIGLPVIVVGVPVFYEIARPFIYLLLVAIVCTMILSEKGKKKVVAAGLFLLAGSIGVLMDSLPINDVFVLFPVFSGFFGLSMVILQLRSKVKIPRQKESRLFVSRKTVNRSVIVGALGGIFSGFLPGVGSSEIASLASVDKNGKSFLITIGAITTANIILSVLSLWLISKPRSGVAVAVSQIATIGSGEVAFIVAVSIFSVGAGAIATLLLAKKFTKIVQKVNYSKIGISIAVFIVVASFLFAGFPGLLLLITCTALGVFTNLVGVKRGTLMGVLILPTALFYAGF